MKCPACGCDLLAALREHDEKVRAEEREAIAAMIEHDELSLAGSQPLDQCGLPAAIRARVGEQPT